MFKWTGWNKYTRNKLNQIAADASAGGGGDSGGGGGGGILIVKEIQTGSTGTLDKTFQEIFDAITAGKNVYVWPNAPADASFPPNVEEPNDVTIYPVYIGFHSVGSHYQVLIDQSQSWHADAWDGYASYYYD